MNVLTGVGILLLSMLIIVFLQLTPAIFMIFSHYASAKYSRQKTSNLALFFILGVEAITTLVFILIYTIVMSTAEFEMPLTLDSYILIWCLVVIFATIGLIFPWVYFRKGKGTQLFIGRRLAEQITKKARDVKTQSEAFLLGFIAGVPELIFTLPLYFVSVTAIMAIGETTIARSAMVILIVLAAVLPLFFVHISLNHGFNLANLERARTKNKTFYRMLIGILYLLIAVMLIVRTIG